MIEFELNGKSVTSESDADTPLLWVVRDELKLKGTKYGCGIARCGVCTVHVDGAAVRSCIMPVAAVAGRSVTTIEGLATQSGQALQQAWVDAQVAAMRVLPVRADHAGRESARQQPAPDRRADHSGDERQPVPLHGLYAHSQSDQDRRRQGGVVMAIARSLYKD